MKSPGKGKLTPEEAAVIDLALAEAERKDATVQTLCDDLSASLQADSSPVLQDILRYLCEYLLDRHSPAEIKGYWQERLSPMRRCSSSGALFQSGIRSALPEADELAIGLLQSMASAMRMEDSAADGLVLGRLGVRGKKAFKDGRTGGQNAGEKKKKAAEKEHAKWASIARQLIASGKRPREVSGIISERVDRTPTAVRTALQKAGVIPKRNETKVS